MEMQFFSPTVESATVLAPSVPFDPRATEDAAFIRLYDTVETGNLDDQTTEYLLLRMQLHWLQSDHRVDLDPESDIIAQLSNLSIAKIDTKTDTNDKNKLFANDEVSAGNDLAMDLTLDRLRWILYRTRALKDLPRPHKPRTKAWVYLYASNAAYGKTAISTVREMIASLLEFVRQDLDRMPMSEEDEEALRRERLQVFTTASAGTPWVVSQSEQLMQGEGSTAQQSVQAERSGKGGLKWQRNMRPLTAETRQRRRERKDEKRVHRLQLKLQTVNKGVLGRKDKTMRGMDGVRGKKGSKSVSHGLAEQQHGKYDEQPKRKKRSLRYQQTKQFQSVKSKDEDGDGVKGIDDQGGEEDMNCMEDDHTLGNEEPLNITEAMEGFKLGNKE